MKVNGQEELDKVMELFIMLMGQSMKVIGKII